MNLLSALTSVGLHDEEAQLYLALLRIKEGTASEVAKAIGRKRTAVYPLLDALVLRGFATIRIKGYARRYAPSKPESIAHYFTRKLSALEDALPALNALLGSQFADGARGMRYIENEKALWHFYGEQVSRHKGGLFRVIANNKHWNDFDPDFLSKYLRERAQAKITTRLLLTSDSMSFNPTDESLRRDVRFLPKNYSSFSGTLNIYPDNVSIIEPTENGLGVVIDIPAMVTLFQSVFDMLWDSLA